jgi:hypothetical protein
MNVHENTPADNRAIALWEHTFADLRGYLCIAYYDRAAEEMRQKFFRYPEDVERAQEFALYQSEQGRDAYFCAHLLQTVDGAVKRRKTHAIDIRALWADGDGAQVPEDKPQPTYALASSPGKEHYYWALKAEISPAYAERLNEGIIEAIGSDASGYDLTQLLRVPGTRNYKYPDAPTVRVLKASHEAYSPAALERAFPPPAEEVVESENGHEIDLQSGAPPVELETEALKVWLGHKPWAKDTGEIDRSATLMHIGRVLYDARATRPAIVQSLRERDEALGYNKYTGREDADKQYHAIVDELQKSGRSKKGRKKASKEETQENQADRMIQYALDTGYELFADQLGAPHAFVVGEALAFNSRCYNWLRGLLWKHEEKSATSEALKQAAGTLAAFAMAGGIVHELHTRGAFHEGAVYYQLGKGRVVEIDRDGWRLCEEPPVYFRSVPNLKPLPDPVRGGSLDALDRLVNLKSDRDKRLMRTYLVTVPLPHIPRPLLEATGVMGSGKTTLGRLIKRLWDPTAPEAVRIDPRDFLQKASHSFIVMLDNQNSLPEWAADTLCRLVTGESDCKRALYTDDEDIIVELKRAVILNGINTPSDRPDVQDRTLPIELDRIPDKDRRPERKLWAEFDKEHPGMLGAAFDALSATLRTYDELDIGNLPRLADWGEYAAAAYVHFGWTVKDFREDWLEIVGKQNQGSLDGSAVAQTILSIMSEHTVFEKSPGELLEVLETEAEKLKINIKRDKKWPGSPSWVWRRIKEVLPALNAMGIEAEDDHKRTGSRITLRRSSPDDDGGGGGSGGGDGSGGGCDGISADAVTYAVTGNAAWESQGDSSDSSDGISGHSSPTTLASIEENRGLAGECDPKSDPPREVSINAVTAVTPSQEHGDADPLAERRAEN